MAVKSSLSSDRSEFARYLLNGLLATATHFGVLTWALEVARLPSAGLANLMAALVGITVSFLGNRHFVFRSTTRPASGQMLRFGLLYGGLALLHGTLLYLWTDRAAFDYRLGFLLATGVQVVISYLGNKKLVFL